ncbi:MAG: cadherin-like beta sandwich domain-containing protein [Nitrospira sp.]|nr:cadherin-like beta sandwich domain-containing protein [Nitrospira sp.]
MKYILTMTRFCHTVLLVAIIWFSATSCQDSVSVSENTVEVPLSSLTVTPGTLQPAFSSNTTSYLIEVSTTVSTVTVTATPRDSSTTLSINGIDTNPGQGRPITLSSSQPTTTITIVVTSQNGLESTYDILVRKVDNTLSALSVTPPGAFPAPGFVPSTLTYQVDVASSINSVTVVATKADPHAVMSGSVTAGAGSTAGQAIIPLNGPGQPTVVSITVAVPNSEAKTYTITVQRAALSSNNNLSALTVTPPGSFPPPGFIPSTLNYTVNVATNVNRVDVTATKSDINAVMAIGSVIVPAGTASGSALNIPLDGPGSPTTISIVVTAQNGSPKTYSVTVNRAASTDDTLSALTVAANSLGQPLVPGFSASTVDYTVNVASAVTEVIVSATKSDRSAVMLIGSLTVPAGTSSGQATFPLGGLGTQTVVSISVTAQSGGAPKTYTIRVNRAASTDDTLSALTVTANSIEQPLVPSFSAITLGYSVSVESIVDQVTVSATKSDLNAVMAIGSVTVPAGTASGSAPNIPLSGPGTPTVVSIFVTAQSGGVPKIYTIIVNRAL